MASEPLIGGSAPLSWSTEEEEAPGTLQMPAAEGRKGQALWKNSILSVVCEHPL